MKAEYFEKGHKFNYLTVIKEVKGKRRTYRCKCVCGEITNVDVQNLKSGHTKSCGCYKGLTGKNIIHGMSGTRIYITWQSMNSRCSYKGYVHYKHYGGRGIKCEWKTFMEFYKDMGNTYGDNLQIDRIDNDGNYCKENCRWVTQKENARNKRNNITYKGKCLAEWCEELGYNYSTIQSRIREGKTIEEALLLNI